MFFKYGKGKDLVMMLILFGVGSMGVFIVMWYVFKIFVVLIFFWIDNKKVLVDVKNKVDLEFIIVGL